MAYDNINERREYVKFMLEFRVSDKEIRKVVSEKFMCHTAAVNADLQFLRHGSTGKYHLNKSIRDRIYKRDGKKCYYCQTEEAYEYIVEHIVPASMGGKAIDENLVIACSSCNILKKKQIWIPANFMEIAKNNYDHLHYVLENATKDFRIKNILFNNI